MDEKIDSAVRTLERKIEGMKVVAPTSGMSDEEKLGFTYNMLDEYISDSNADIPADTRELIDKKTVILRTI